MHGFWDKKIRDIYRKKLCEIDTLLFYTLDLNIYGFNLLTDRMFPLSLIPTTPTLSKKPYSGFFIINLANA